MPFDPNTEDFEKAYWWDEDMGRVTSGFVVETATTSIGIKKKPPQQNKMISCIDCGFLFIFHPNKKYCNDCSLKHRQEQQRIQSKKRYQEKVKNKRARLLNTLNH